MDNYHEIIKINIRDRLIEIKYSVYTYLNRGFLTIVFLKRLKLFYFSFFYFYTKKKKNYSSIMFLQV